MRGFHIINTILIIMGLAFLYLVLEAGHDTIAITGVLMMLSCFTAGAITGLRPRETYIMDKKELDQIMIDIELFPYDKVGNAQISRGMVRLIVEDAINRDRHTQELRKELEAKLKEEDAMMR